MDDQPQIRRCRRSSDTVEAAKQVQPVECHHRRMEGKAWKAERACHLPMGMQDRVGARTPLGSNGASSDRDASATRIHAGRQVRAVKAVPAHCPQSIDVRRLPSAAGMREHVQDTGVAFAVGLGAVILCRAPDCPPECRSGKSAPGTVSSQPCESASSTTACTPTPSAGPSGSTGASPSGSRSNGHEVTYLTLRQWEKTRDRRRPRRPRRHRRAAAEPLREREAPDPALPSSSGSECSGTSRPTGRLRPRSDRVVSRTFALLAAATVRRRG